MTASPAQVPSPVAERVLDTVALILNVDRDRLSLDTSIREDLKADSMDVVSLSVALEDEFQGSIDEAEANRFRTVGDIVRYIETHTASRSP